MTSEPDRAQEVPVEIEAALTRALDYHNPENARQNWISFKREIAAALARARDEALLEAAAVADRKRDEHEFGFMREQQGLTMIAEQIGKEIRALRTARSSQTDKEGK